MHWHWNKFIIVVAVIIIIIVVILLLLELYYLKELLRGHIFNGQPLLLAQ